MSHLYFIPVTSYSYSQTYNNPSHSNPCWGLAVYDLSHMSSENEEFNEGERKFKESVLLVVVVLLSSLTRATLCHQIYPLQTAYVPTTTTPHIICIVHLSSNGRRISEDLLSECLISSQVLGVELLYCEFSFLCMVPNFWTIHVRQLTRCSFSIMQEKIEAAYC